MSDQWPSEPGQQPPVAGQGGPPTAGEPAADPWSGAGAMPASPRATQQAGWGGGPPPAQTPPPGGGSGSKAVLFAAIVVVVALVVGAATFLLLRSGGEDETAEPAPSTSTEAPDPTSTAPAALTDEEVAAEVEVLSNFVAEARGLEFLERVEVVVADDEDFNARLAELVVEDTEELELQGRLLAALGMIEPDLDLVTVTGQLLTEGVLGFYNRETDELVVRGTELTPYVRQTIVHELTHALDDQHFELWRPDYEEMLDETPDGFVSVIEGSGRYVEDLWEASLTPDELDALEREEARYALEADIGDIPFSLIGLLVAPYEEGLVFVEDILDSGGMSALDAALADPPSTTEQVRHPDKYLAGEERVEVPAPPVDGELLDEGVFGERMIALMLGGELDPTSADLAASGWAGDWYVGYEPPDGGTCVRVDILSESAEEHTELVEALEQYAFDLPEATIEEPAAETVRFTSCVPPSAGGGAADRS